jgi:Flp pilus assembly protein TadD
MLRRAQRLDEARQAYDAALARDPSQPRARIGLACLAGVAGDAATCEAQAREALRRTPWSPQAQQFVRLVNQARGSTTPDSFRRYLFVQ